MMTEREDVSRRHFLKQSGRAAAALSASLAPGSWASAQEAATGANDRIVLGLIGCGGRGQYLMSGFMQRPGTAIGAVCDVDESRLNQARAVAGEQARAYQDFRRLLEQEDIDAVIVATPDHWHAIPTILACEAGKDVYVEKPLAHNVAEGRAMVAAARRYDRVVQMGVQQRSGTHYQRAVQIVRNGDLGPLSRVHVWNVWNQSEGGTGSGRNAGIGNPPDGDPPPGVDYDMWLGPAPLRPFNPNRFHSNFYYFWDYSGGMILAWGIHHTDIVHWAMGQDRPLAAVAAGGTFALEDNRETPDTLNAVIEYPGFTLMASCHHANAHPIEGRDYGIAFYGTRGTLVIDRGGFEVFPEGDRMEPIRSGSSPQDEVHQQHFLDCIRTRQRSIADVEDAHNSTIPCHLANIAFRTGRKVHWDAENEQIIGDDEANQYLTRTYREPWHI